MARRPGFLGVAFRGDANKPKFVETLVENGPAANCGLRVGDQVVTLNGIDILSLGVDHVAHLCRGDAGAPITFNVNRSGQKLEFLAHRGEAVVQQCVVRELLAADLKPASFVIAQAVNLADESFFHHYFEGQSEEQKLKGLQWVNKHVLKYLLDYGRVWGAFHPQDGCVGVAYWAAPTADPSSSMIGMLKHGFAKAPWVIGLGPTRRITSLLHAREDTLKKVIGSNPCWRLFRVAVLPSHQRRGICPQLLAPVLDAAELAGIPCYADCPRSQVDYFVRFGFIERDLHFYGDVEYFSIVRRPGIEGRRVSHAG
mmetsp:Transcript_1761/g.4962  ORF Transcript_1761/g.4962 Transcript_1761/m.4962 type:complete len:312 (+) Transcript_1761:2-937(+)